MRLQGRAKAFRHPRGVAAAAPRGQFHGAPVQAPRLQQLHLQREDFGIHPRRRRLEAFDAALMKLAAPAGLRPLAAEHRPDVEPPRSVGFLRPQSGGMAHDPGRAFRPQAQAPPALLEHVHFLLHHVGRFADGPRENGFKLDHGRPQLVKPVARQNLAGHPFETLPDAHFGRGDVGHALYGPVD